MPPVSPTPSFLSSTPKETGRTRRFALEGLEPRWLLSATPVAAALQAAFPVQEPEPLWQEAVQPAQASATVAASGQLDLSQDTASQGVPGAWASASVGAAPASVWVSSSLDSPLGDARLQTVYDQARSAVQAFLSQTHALDLQALFPGDGSGARVLLHTEAVRQDWLQGAGSVTLTLASNEQLGGAMAAFTARGPSGGAEVFVNRQWLNGMATDADLLRVLVEELGHGLDAALNGERDSPGDEGELFAAHVLALPLEPAARQRMALEDDHALMWWGMSSFAVEQANFNSSQNITDGRMQDATSTITGNVVLTSTFDDGPSASNDGRLIVGSNSTSAGDPRSFLDGDGAGDNDALTIRAGGVVRFFSALGVNDPLASLTITSPTAAPTDFPNSIVFEQDVTLDGPLTIETNGDVIFQGKLTITSGDLTIRGASLILFNKEVIVANNILLEGNEINLENTATLKSTGAGVLTLRSTTLALGMEVGSPSTVDLNKLDISAAELEDIAGGGFSKIVLGHVTAGHATAGQGQVRIAGAQGANQYSFQAPLEVYGNTIRIEDIASNANPGLAIKGSVKLDATGNIEIRNRLLASTDLSQASALQNITLYSATGSVTQSDETSASLSDGLVSEPLQGAALLVDAVTGINLFATEVNTASLTNTGSGNIRLVEAAAGGGLTLLKAMLGNASDTTVTSGMVSVQTLSTTDGDLTLTPAAVIDVSAPGSVSLRAGAALTLGSNADLMRPDGADAGTDLDVMTGTLDLQSGTAMVLTGRTLKAVGDIRVQAGTSLALGSLESTGKVALIAGGSITDGDADVDVTAAGLLVQAGAAGGVGTSTDALETTVATFSAAAGSGGLFVLETNALLVDTVSVTVNRLSSTGTNATEVSSQSDLRTSAGNGAIVLRTTAGSLTLGNTDADGVAVSSHGTGNVLLQALGAGTDITANADILSTNGNVSLRAAQALSFAADADVRTASTAAGNGSIDLEAGSSAITMNASSVLLSTGATATARLVAGTSVTVGDITLATGAVSITAGTSILDADPLTGGTTNDTDQDITAVSLRLNAGTVMADSVNQLETTVGSLTASSAGSVYLLEADDLTVGSVAVSVNRVGSAAAVSTVTDAAQADIRTSANGNIVLRSTAGDLTLSDGNTDGVALSANGSGNVLVEAMNAGKSITVNADVSTGSGNLSVLAGLNLTLGTNADLLITGATPGTASIDAEATAGALLMSSSSTMSSSGTGATARLKAGTSVTVGDIALAAGAVSITAGTSILDADPLTGGTTNDTDQDITAVSLRLNAGTVMADSVNHLETTVGSLTASSAGSVYLLEADDLTVGSVAVSVNRVGSAAAVSTVTDAAQADILTSANGNIVLRSTAGDLTLSDGNTDGVALSANGSGNVLVEAMNAGKSLTVSADVATGSGNVSVLAGLNLTLGTNADLLITGATPGTASIDAEATAGALLMSASSTMSSSGTGATARLKAGTSVTVGDIAVAAGAVSITAGTSILDADPLTGGTTNDTDQDITAVSLRLNAGTVMADSVNHLETTVGSLTASSAGSVYLLEADDLTVGSVAVSVNRVGSAAAVTTVTDAAQADIRTSANGNIVLRSTAGDLTLSDGNTDGVALSANGSGNVLVEAMNAGKSITVNADVSTGTGNVSVLAGLNLTLGTNADLLITGATPGTASIDAEATAGALLMSASSTMSSSGTGATARLKAGTSVTVGDIAVAAGAVSITAGTSILDADPLTGGTTNDTDQDITAVSLRLNAGTVMADSVNHLETTVGSLTASSAGSVYLLEADDLTVGSVAVSVNRVGSAAAVTTVTDAAQADIRTSANGNIVLRSTAGDLTLSDGNTDGVALSANGSGNVLVEAMNAGKSLTVSADVATGSGNLSVLAGLNLTLGTNADLLITGATPGTASIDAEATAGALLMSASSTMSSSGTGATARLKAGTSVTVGDIAVAAGAVSITAGTSILDADPLTGGTTNDTDQDITAVSLRLNAGTVMADSVNHLETTVGSLTASSAGSVYLLEADDLTVGSVAVSVNRVGSAAAVTTVTDAAQADIRTSANGNIVLRSTAGDLTLSDGNTDGVALSANGSGNVLVEAMNAGKSITVNADVSTGTGNVSVLAGLNLTLGTNADLLITGATPGTASIDAEATAGALLMSASSTMSSSGTGATARLKAGTSVTVGDIAVAAGAVSITAGTSILDADPLTGGTTNDTDQDITAVGLRLNAGTVMADSVNHLETTVGSLTASSAGSVYLLEADDLTVGSVAVSVNRVGSAAAVTTVTDAAQADIRTSANGNIVLRSTAGDLTLSDGNTDGVALSANGSGNVLVEAMNAGKSLTVSADVATGSGNLSVLAGLNLTLGTNADLLITGATPGTASIDAEATAGALLMSASSTMSSSGTGATARLKAGTSVTVGDIALAAGAVSITAGTSILDADPLTGGTTNDTDQDITAVSLRLNAGTVMADSVNHLETTVGSLTASSAGSVYLLEADDLTVGSVAVSVNRVGLAAAVTTVSDVAQADVRTSANNGAIALRSTAGHLTLDDGNTDGVAISAHGTGNVLLQTLGALKDITVNADILSTNGNVSVLAAQALGFAADANVRTASLAAGNGSIDLEAGTGAITMHASSVLLSTGASATARLVAATSVTVGDISLATGSVSITATAGAIADADPLTGAANDTDQDITASALRMLAGTAIAASVNHLETTVATLTAQAASGGVYLLEADDLTVGSVAVSVNRVGSGASTSAASDAAQADVRTTGGNGAIVLRSTAGHLTLNDGNTDGVALSAHGSGNVLVQALNAGKSITVNADVSSSTGNLSVLAGLDLTLGVNADLLITGTTPGAASIDAEAGAGALLMSASSAISSSGSGATARLKAATSVTVGDVSLAAGAVSITAGTSILDADALVSAANDPDQDITALGLRLNAGTVIADSVNQLETTVATLTAAAAGSVYLLEADDLTVGSVAVSVNRVASDELSSAVSDVAQADVRTSANGNIVLRTTAGSLTLNDGNTDGVALSAHGTGTVLLQAQGTGSDLTVNASVQSGTGHVTLQAADAVNLSANVKTDSTGTLSVAAGGALTQLGSTTIEATGSSLRLSAGQDLTLGNVVASQVSLVSTGGAVVNADGSSKNVTATALRIEADDAVGSAARSLSTAVRTLSVASTGSQSAGVFLTEDNGLTLGSVSVNVTEVTSAGAAASTATTDAAAKQRHCRWQQRHALATARWRFGGGRCQPKPQSQSLAFAN